MLPEVPLILHCRMSGSRWMITPSWLSASWRSFLYNSVCSCRFFSRLSASVRSILFLSFIVPVCAWNVPLVSLIFLERSLVFPILLFSSVSLHWSLRRWSYLSLLFFGTLHSDGCIFPFLLCLSLVFSAVCKASSDNPFCLLAFLLLADGFDHHILYSVT